MNHETSQLLKKPTDAEPARQPASGSHDRSRRAITGILATVHESAVGLHTEHIFDAPTLREYARLCLIPTQERDA